MEAAVSVDTGMTANVMIKSNNCCSVTGCLAKSSTHPFLRFHIFPKANSSFLYMRNMSGQTVQIDRRQLWEKILLLREPPGAHHRVCSLHFQRSDYYRPDMRAGQGKLNNTAVPTLKLPQRSKPFQSCSVKNCNVKNPPNKEFYTILQPVDYAKNSMWCRWTQALGIFKPCTAITVCADHFVTGRPSYNPTDTDFAPSLNVSRIEEVNVSNSFESAAEATLEDPLKLPEPELLPLEENVQVKEELLDYDMFEDCIKVEPVDVKMEPDEHSYCK